MLLFIILVMVVYFAIGGIVGYILGRAFGRVFLVVFCGLLGVAIVALLVPPMIGWDLSAILGDDAQGNRIMGQGVLLPALVGAILFGGIGLGRRARVQGGQG